jgi:hypothetical protein
MHLQYSETIRNCSDIRKLGTGSCDKWWEQCDEGLIKFHLENE